ncbi:MAG: hypothetical protein IPO83_18230 [Chitinophagaceae bacterium]|nr:hypothetical protein [Chitinophagaceae bacterium]
MAEYKTFNQLPETTPDEIERKAKAYKKFIDGKGFIFLKAMADTQVAQFFIPKTEANKDYLMTDADFRLILSGYKGWQDRKVAKATAIALEQRFFHWFIEFPEVFDEGGFDCDLGNPPFLGGQKISTALGNATLNCIHYVYPPTSGTCDLVAYFFRRAFSLIKTHGFISLISTKTISQGDTRLGGLEKILFDGGRINHAIRSIKWPGEAAVKVSLVTIYKGMWSRSIFLEGKEVHVITAYLDDAKTKGNPYALNQNENKSFIGSYVLGLGYVLETSVAFALIDKNQKNKMVLFPYLNGDDLNNNIDQKPSRWVINFFSWPLKRYDDEEWGALTAKEKEKILTRIKENKVVPFAPPKYEGYVASDFPDCLNILEELVKPERQRWKKDARGIEIEGKYALREPLPEFWWIYGEKRPALYKAIASLDKVSVHTRVTKTHAFVFVPNGWVYSEAIVVFKDDRFSLMQSSIHEYWAWNYSSSMKGDRRYSASDAFETFPFPQDASSNQNQKLEQIGNKYYEYRQQLMLGIQLGLTKTYNLFHCNAITTQSITDKDKLVMALRKHLDKTTNTISFDEATKGILKLRELHIQIDYAVLTAYGWNDIELRHDFYEVDYLPENDRVRFTIHPDARREVLKRLLELNHKIHEEEVKAGLWDKKRTSGKKSRSDEVSEPEVGYGGLFNQEG